jgi:6-hydroxytryprostatin B O-methyltransferase
MTSYLYSLIARIMSPLIQNGFPSPVSQEDSGEIETGPVKNELLTELASSIATNAQVLSTFLQSEGHPMPSFERDAAPKTIPASAPSEIQAAREALLDASMKMFQLASGPSEYLPNLAVHVRRPLSITS